MKMCDYCNKKFDYVKILNQFAIFSTMENDVIFTNKNRKMLIFCGGIIKNFKQNVYNFKKKEFIGYISYKQDLNIELSTNLILKLRDSENLNLISILPYASYAMKILRRINPKIGHKILIIGLNFFSILLMKLFKLTGTSILIIKLDDDLKQSEIIPNISNNIIYGLNEAIEKMKSHKFDTLIINKAPTQILNDFKNYFNVKNQFFLNQISIYDKGFSDPNFFKGVKYPPPYLRWHYKTNLQYFIELIEGKIIDISFLNILKKEVNSLKEAQEFINNFQNNALILFKFQN